MYAHFLCISFVYLDCKVTLHTYLIDPSPWGFSETIIVYSGHYNMKYLRLNILCLDTSFCIRPFLMASFYYNSQCMLCHVNEGIVI